MIYENHITSTWFIISSIFRSEDESLRCDKKSIERDFAGGKSGSYKQELSKASSIAFDKMNQKDKEMGANCVIDIDIDYDPLGDTGSMLIVSINGTANIDYVL